MAPALDKPRLRRVLRRLWEIPAFGEMAEIAQESLDFLALIAGIKPVYVLGRGYDNRVWLEGVRALAEEQRLFVVEGPLWQPAEALRGYPDWYVAQTRAAIGAGRADYVAKTRAAQVAVEAACVTGTPTISEEARLLGFPECCVVAHHERARAFHDATLMIARRRTGGDEAAMSALLDAGETLAPETDEESALAEAATSLAPGPFTSLNLCRTCARSPKSPGMRVVERYGDLAAAIDPDYFAVLAEA